MPVEILKEVVREVPVDREVVREVPVEVVKEIVREVPVDREVGPVEGGESCGRCPLTAKSCREVVREVPVEVIREVEVVREIPSRCPWSS